MFDPSISRLYLVPVRIEVGLARSYTPNVMAGGLVLGLCAVSQLVKQRKPEEELLHLKLRRTCLSLEDTGVDPKAVNY